MNTISDAQRDMAAAYVGGAGGAFASAAAWLSAALVSTLIGATAGIVTLVVAGMMIFPVSILISKALGATGKHSKGNPLAPLAIYGTLWMVMSILIALAAAQYRTDWFFPAMLLVIGGRYLTFETLYGMRIYLAFGASLAFTAIVLVALQAPAAVGAYAGALIEFTFASLILASARKQSA